jgi:hypothetical protein
MDIPTREVDKIDAVAYLLYEKFKYVDYKLYGKKIVFLFEDTPELKKALLSFLNKTARVDPQNYNNQVRELIRLMRELLKEGVSTNE